MRRFLRTNSLSFRLFVLAAGWSLLALVVAAVVLLADYRYRAERGHEAFLDLHLLNVIATTELEDERLVGMPATDDARFRTLHSGWYWQVMPRNAPEAALTSPSLAGARLELPDVAEVPYDEEFRRSFLLPGPEGQELKAIERLVLLGEEDLAYSFVVAGDTVIPQRSVTAFGTRMAAVFAVLGVGLVAITVLQVRFGLRPLRRVGKEVEAIREGRAERLEGKYPDEIEPLTREINALIESNAKIVERARMHVGNLAHALKTPLSVITNAARAKEETLPDKAIEQAELMRHQLDFHLDRARMAAGPGAVGAVTEVKPVIDALERAMSRIYSERDIDLQTEVEELRFHGERQDLEEMVGNLIDNACKWARGAVRLTCRRLPDNPDSLEIVVDDDGPGLSEADKLEAVRRGRRLDESKPGSGLGLSIVSELVGLYQGAFELCRSPAGGLRVRLRLPAA